MKTKLYSLLSICMMMIASLSLQGCDDDAVVASYINGAWSGRTYVHTDYGNYVYESTYSEVEFNSGWDSGTGYWVDYYSDAPFDYVANHITWKVMDGNIYIHYVEENSNVVIYDYSLSNNYFSGRIETDNGNLASFRLRRITGGSSYWDDFHYGYDYYYSGWSKANTMRVAPQQGTTEAKPTRIFKQYTNN